MDVKAPESPLELFSFRWYRREGGCFWTRKAKLVQPRDADAGMMEEWTGFLLQRHPELPPKVYYPLTRYPQLYIKFAKLGNPQKGSSTRIRRFAEKYGMLGVQQLVTFDAKQGPPGENPKAEPVLQGESYYRWISEVRDMSMLLQVWDWLQQRDVGKLGQHVVWRLSEGQVFFSLVTIGKDRVPGMVDWGGPERVWQWMNEIWGQRPNFAEVFERLIASEEKSPRVFSQWQPHDVLGPAGYFLVTQVNKKLVGCLSPKLTVNEEMGFDARFEPRNLLSALWLQFSRAITGDQEIRRCAVCHQWMNVTENTKGKRMHDKCSQLQRSANYRKRNRQAKDALV